MDKEILDEFKSETLGLVKELASIVDQLEDDFDTYPSQLMVDFSQRIDRIMGAATTVAMTEPDHIGLARVGQLTSLCKKLGHQAAAAKRAELIPIFAAFWADTVEVVQEIVQSLEDKEKCKVIADKFSGVLQKRLEWLSKHLGKSSPQGDVEALLRELGL